MCGDAPARSRTARLVIKWFSVTALILLTAYLAPTAEGQDRRKVAEPRIPMPCATLSADLTAVDHDATIPSADEDRLDTKRIQRAIDSCPPGHAVELKASGTHDAFLSGPLQLRSEVTLVVGVHTFLFGSRDPRDYDVAPGRCGVVNHDGRGCKPLIGADHANGAGVMGGGVIDGRGGAKLLRQSVSWWDLAEQARGDDLRQNCPRLLQLNGSNNFTLYGITLKNSPNFHVAYSGGDGFTAWGVIINTPKHARNTDGIDPISATDVTITRCYIHDGDDNVAIKAGNSGPSSHISVSDNHFYAGHGVSIGSETSGGVSAVRVSDLSIDGADNGIRIKSNVSRGGLVQDVIYQDVCIRDTKNPILINTHYPFFGPARNRLPVFGGIVLRDIRVLDPGKITLEGYDSTHRLGLQLDNVFLGFPQLTKIISQHAKIKLGPGPVNFLPAGTDVRVTGEAGSGRTNPCDGKFVPLPAS